MKLPDFKHKVLCEYIHHEERYPRVNDLFENARTILLLKRDNCLPGRSYYDSHSLFILLAGNIERYKNIIQLCGYLKDKKAFNVGSVQVEETYYEDYFKAKISTAKMYMRKLQPYVIKYTAGWSQERKQKDCELPEIGKYFNKWYLNINLQNA